MNQRTKCDSHLHEVLNQSRINEDSERIQFALDAGAIIGTWVWDIPSDRFTADERFARSFGLSGDFCQAGLPLEHMMASIHIDDVTRVQQAIREVLERGGRYRCEYRVLQNEVFRWIEANGRVQFSEDGTPQRFAGILLDIEPRRVAETERDRVMALLRTFTSAIPGVVYAKDLDGRLIIANQGTTDLIGKTPEEYLGKTDFESLEDKAQALNIMETDRRIMQSGVAEQVEEEVRLADGSAATWLSVKTPLRDDSGKTIGLIGSSIDVTARKRAESAVQELNATLEHKVEQAIREREAVQEALRQSQKMEAVGQLTGGLAHDFNNLLTGITGSLELLQIRITQGKISDVERYLNAAQGAAKRAAALTHRLLAFSRRQTLDPKPTDMNRLIVSMEDLIRRTVGPHIHIELVGAGGLWRTLIDQNQLENALLNLCINARDAMQHGGRITIETANRWMDERVASERDLPPGQYVSLSVTDTGTGMTPEVIARAFDPFFTTKPIGAGTGLGLSMIYGFVRQSGGQVRIYSELGKGTTMCLYVPRYRDEGLTIESESLAAKTNFTGDGEVVLIVDDEATIRMLVGDVLADGGYSGIEAVDGQSGLKVLESAARIDLLITDVGLPGGINGRQLADAARVLRPRLKVLFITGYAENAVVGNGHLESGMHILTKPFSMQSLAEKIKRIVEG